MRLARWLLIVPTAVIAWYAAILLGISLDLGLEALCPADQTISGLCVAPWYKTAFAAVTCVGAGFAAVLVLLACTWLAPSHRRLVATATFSVGAVVAIFMGVSANAMGPLITALLAGAVVLWILVRRLAPASGPSATSSGEALKPAGRAR